MSSFTGSVHRNRGFLCFESDGTEQQPDQNIGRNDCRQGKGNADPIKVPVGNGMTFFSQNADAGDVGGSADGGTVAAQGSTGKQSEVQCGGIDTHFLLRLCHSGQLRG